MTRDLFEALLLEDESTSLDLKREQYPFEGAPDAVKGELLKDILAFANAWRRTDAFILIGVQEVKGGQHVPLGVSQHLEDAALQQFVNSKTQRPISFAYETFDYDGTSIGIIRIPVQERPFYLKKDYGKLKRLYVYVRRGSSTAEAEPDEVIRMRAVPLGIDQSRPRLSLELVDPDSRDRLGTTLDVQPRLLQVPPRERIPTVDVPHWAGGMYDSDYLRNLIEWMEDTEALVSLGFCVTNHGGRAATDVRIRLSGSTDGGIRVLDEETFPDRPTYHLLLGRRPDELPPEIVVEQHGAKWSLTVRLGTILPQETVYSRERFYLGASKAQMLDLEAGIFAHELEQPAVVPLSFRIAPVTVEMNPADLITYFEEDRFDYDWLLASE